jgi:hypothetical protein
VQRALLGRITQVDRTAARKLQRGDVRLTLVYYGDLTTALMVRARPEREASMIRRRGKLFEPPGEDQPWLDQLVARPLRRHTAEDYKQLVREHRDLRFLDDVLRVASPLGSLTRLGIGAIARLFPDLGAYLRTREWGSQIRRRVQRVLSLALRQGDDIALVTHSMGCIVAYDVLWKLSRLSEHRRMHDKKVSLWLTMGSALGDGIIRRHLYDSDEPADGVYPANIADWINVAAHDDFVVHHAKAEANFAKMRERGLVRSIRDLPRIHTFWVGPSGSNPHKSLGYINHPVVARTLAKWIRK